MMTGVWQDLVHAFRRLRHQPRLVLAAAAILGTAIGLNASLFAFFNAAALKPWPVKDPDRVVRVYPVSDQPRSGAWGFSLAEWRYWTDHARSFDGLLAGTIGGEMRIGDHEIDYQFVSANYFDVLGVPFAHGRGFRAGQDGPGAAAAVVLGHAAWQRVLGGDPGVIGRTVRLDGIPLTVIGVTSREFGGTLGGNRTDAWMPLSAWPLFRAFGDKPKDHMTDPRRCCHWIAGRLAPGVETEQARAELETLSGAFRASFGMEPERIRLAGTDNASRGPSGALGRLATEAAPFASVTLVLLLACANVGNLLIARGYARRREIAVRLSLGATRARLVRELLYESLLLAVLAGLAGLGIASVLPRLIVAAMPNMHLDLSLDHRVLAYTIGVVLLACLVSGLAPALHNTRTNVSAALKDAHGLSVRRLSLRSALLAAQVAIAVVLLASGGLLGRGLQHARTKDLGFGLDGLDVVSIETPWAMDGARRREIAAQVRQELEALPGRERIAATDWGPRWRRLNTDFRWAGSEANVKERALTDTVSATYFRVLGTPLVAGRGFEHGDARDAVAVVNEAFVRRYSPAEPPLGRILVQGRHRRQIVGVVRDAYLSDLTEVEPTIFRPLEDGSVPEILVRGGGAAAVVTAVSRIDPDLRVTVQSAAERLDERLVRARLGARLAGGIGLLALLLAGIGLAGVFAYAVEQRTREIGIRITLGARAVHVFHTVFSTAARSLLVGTGAGVIGAAAASFILRGALYGLNPLDPGTCAAVAGLLLLAALAATYVPARRAMRIEPTVALRYE